MLYLRANDVDFDVLELGGLEPVMRFDCRDAAEQFIVAVLALDETPIAAARLALEAQATLGAVLAAVPLAPAALA